MPIADHLFLCSYYLDFPYNIAYIIDVNRVCPDHVSTRILNAGEQNMVTIRKAESSDHEAVWEIIREVISGGDTYVFDPETPKEEMLAYWLSPEKYVYVAEDENGLILGTFWLKPNQPGLGDHVCNAAYMVAGSAKEVGVGRRMGEYSLDEARRLGFHAMQFNFVVASNTAAVRLWESIGMQIIGTVPDAFRHKVLGLTDSLIMYRRL
jgi:L-amino acid N-acyltransferase YncA